MERISIKRHFESQKGINVIQRCSVENQKGTDAVQTLWRLLAVFKFSTEEEKNVTRHFNVPLVLSRRKPFFITM